MTKNTTSVTLCLVWLLLTGCQQSNDQIFLSRVDEVRDDLSASVDIRETPLSDESLVAQLNGLAGLKKLNLDRSPITDAGLQAIGPLPQLGHLSLSRTQITNDGVKTLVEHYPSLVFLRLDETVVTDEGVEALADLPRLKELSLYRLRTTDRGCKSLAKMSSLQRLSLDGSMISDAGLKALGEMPALEHLSIWQCRGVSDGAIEKFEQDHPNIKVNR